MNLPGDDLNRCFGICDPAMQSFVRSRHARGRIELFLKWIKQQLHIKAFFGTTENAVKTQIWIAVPVYVPVTIVKKRLHLSASLYQLLQILSLTLFERIPLDQLLTLSDPVPVLSVSRNQLNSFK